MGAYTDTHVECFEKVGASTVFGHIFKNILRKREVLPFLGASTICGNIFKDILRKREVSPFMGAYTDTMLNVLRMWELPPFVGIFLKIF